MQPQQGTSPIHRAYGLSIWGVNSLVSRNAWLATPWTSFMSPRADPLYPVLSRVYGTREGATLGSAAAVTAERSQDGGRQAGSDGREVCGSPNKHPDGEGRKARGNGCPGRNYHYHRHIYPCSRGSYCGSLVQLTVLHDLSPLYKNKQVTSVTESRHLRDYAYTQHHY